MKDKKIFIVSALLCVFLFGGAAKAEEGFLQVFNKLNGSEPSLTVVRADQYYPNATDGFDSGLDAETLSVPVGAADITSLIDNPTQMDLVSDYRLEASILPYDIRLFFNGTPGNPTNNLEFKFPYAGVEFGDEEITFSSDRLPYGPVVDVREAIAKNSGGVPLMDAPGTYTVMTPYGVGTLEIGTRLLADLDDSNEVNFEDFAIFTEDYQKGSGQYVADISGPNGIPDGYIDNYDLAAFYEDWLKDINDPNTW